MLVFNLIGCALAEPDFFLFGAIKIFLLSLKVTLLILGWLFCLVLWFFLFCSLFEGLWWLFRLFDFWKINIDVCIRVIADSGCSFSSSEYRLSAHSAKLWGASKWISSWWSNSNLVFTAQIAAVWIIRLSSTDRTKARWDGTWLSPDRSCCWGRAKYHSCGWCRAIGETASTTHASGAKLSAAHSHRAHTSSDLASSWRATEHHLRPNRLRPGSWVLRSHLRLLLLLLDRHLLCVHFS